LELLQVPTAELGAGIALTLAAVDPAGVVEAHAGILQTELSHVNEGNAMVES
jgi:hypothetical protein